MPNGRFGGSASSLVMVFVSLVATVFVGERLLQLTRQVTLLESQLRDVVIQRKQTQRMMNDAGIRDLNELKNITRYASQPCEKSKTEENALDVPFINVQPDNLEDQIHAPRIDEERIQTVGADEDDFNMPEILGQVDLIEDGYIAGWACEKGKQASALDVKFFVNDVFIGETYTNGRAMHPLVDRICAGPANIGADGIQERNVAFKFNLPDLREGLYKLRAFVYSSDGLWRKELNNSPQKFVESTTQPGLSDAIKRKDAVIRARNAQVAALYEQLHTRGIWHRIVDFDRVKNFREPEKQNKYLAFVGLISNPNDIHSRDLQRQAWFPQGDALEKTATEKGIILRFVIGKSDWMTEDEMAAIRSEMVKHKDILVVDMRGFEDPAKKTLAFFSAVAFEYDVDFVFKAEKDVVVDIDALVSYLKPLKNKGNLYMGCMKSGEVVRSARQKWYEPEHWKFGDPQGSDHKINYPRHAHRQFLGVSQLVARYLAQNSEVMHFYANDDVSVGVWLLGLEVEYVDEYRLCCTPRNCKHVGSSVEDRCVGYFEAGCTGVCNPDVAIRVTSESCIKQRQ